MQTDIRNTSRPQRTLFGFSPWLLAGISAVLGAVLVVLALRNSEREQRHVLDTYLDRADALIWALEAGTRTGMGLEIDKRLLQPLIEETARQPGIVFMAIVNKDGRVLAHSDPDEVGAWLPAKDMPQGDPKDVPRCEVFPGGDTLRVYRGFAPLRGRRHGMGPGHGFRGELGHGPGRHGMMPWGHGPADGPSNSPSNGPANGRNNGPGCEAGPPARPGAEPGRLPVQQAEAASFAIIGFDLQPFSGALAADRRNNLLSTLVVAGVGMACLVSLFWAHSYRTSRRKLKDSQALASEVITSLPLGLLTSDPRGRLNTINATALRMLGLERAAVAGQKTEDIPGLDWRALLAALAAGGRVLEREMPLGREKRPVSVSASEIRDEDGLFLGHLFILRDIAEMKRLQLEVQKNERLKALGNLAAGVAHEIRNPLSSIKGLATFLANRTQPGGTEEEAARTMIAETDRLNRVVSQLLEFARPGKPDFVETDVNAVIERALRLSEADAASGGIEAVFKAKPDFPKVMANPERLTQALLNLFLNAVQAMRPGGRLTVSLELQGPDQYAILVRDTGAGIEADLLESVFTPYFTTKTSGAGLGLSIVHQIVESHGGRIRVQSEPGKGSVFTVLLPLRRIQGETA